MKTVWVICGNKGGVGKSLLSLALISCLMRLSRKIAVLDGDGRSPDVYAACRRKIPARAVDFRKLRPDRYDDMLDGEYEALVHELLGISSDLVINTPDGADDVLMKWFDATLRYTEGANCTFRMLYVMNHRGDGLDLLPGMAKRFAYLFPIRNLHFARAPAFSEYNQSHAFRFQETFDFPTLRYAEVTQLLNSKYLPAEFIESQAGGLLARQRVVDWMAEMDNMFFTITESTAANTLPASD
jgi:hypothetical protein